MLPVAPLLLGLGFEEIGLILVVYVLLFGVDKIPQLARSLGRAQARMGEWQRSFEQEVERARWGDQAAFEREREHQMRLQDPSYVEETQVRQAAESLGIPSAGRSVPDLRRAIAARVASMEDQPDAGAEALAPPDDLELDIDETGEAHGDGDDGEDVGPSGDKAPDA